MCYEKAHRLVMASVITLGSVLAFQGLLAGFFVLGFVIVMTVVWGFTDFCPSVWMLRRTGLRSCYGGRGTGSAA